MKPSLTKEEEDELKFQQYLEQYAKPLPQAFIEDMLRTSGKDFDERFGIYFNPEKAKFAVGNLTLEFEGPDILLGGEKLRYKGTPELYEQLFKKNLVGYRNTDLQQYIDILRRSAAHYKLLALH